jgi:hypothetical protein
MQSARHKFVIIFKKYFVINIARCIFVATKILPTQKCRRSTQLNNKEYGRKKKFSHTF